MYPAQAHAQTKEQLSGQRLINNPLPHGHGHHHHRRRQRLRFASISSSCLQLAFVIAIVITLIVEIYLSWNHPGFVLQKQNQLQLVFDHHRSGGRVQEVVLPEESNSDPLLTTINNQVIFHGVAYSLPQLLVVGDVAMSDHNGTKTETQSTTLPPPPPSLVLPLPKPIIAVGLPKAGTSTIWKFFEQAGYKTSHWKIDREQENIPSNLIGICMRDAIMNLSLPPLQHCGNFECWAQTDVAISPELCVFPQITFLEEIHQEQPNATFILNRRELNVWASSVQRWKPAQWSHQGSYSERLSQCQRTKGGGVGVGPESTSTSSLIAWHIQHIERIRNFVKDHPSHALVEIDIEDPQTANYMAYIFQTSPEYWGHANHNNKTHY